MVTGVVTTNMNPNVLGAVPTQLKETPLKSDRRVSVKKRKKKLKRTAQKQPQLGLNGLKKTGQQGTLK